MRRRIGSLARRVNWLALVLSLVCTQCTARTSLSELPPLTDCAMSVCALPAGFVPAAAVDIEMLEDPNFAELKRRNSVGRFRPSC